MKTSKSSSAPKKKKAKPKAKLFKPQIVRSQLVDLKTLDWQEYYFDEKAANLIVDFSKRFCRHIKGEWAGKPVVLAKWEIEILRTLFGWKRRSDDTRRFNTLYLEVPRKNGKSLLGAIIALFMLLCDKEPGAEVYSAAADRKQAALVFDTAKAMIKKDPELSKRCKPYKQTIVVESTNSKYEVLSAEAFTKDGLNASAIIFDELHAQPNRDLYDVLRTSVGSRRQPLEVYITTAGTDINSICFEVHDYAIKIKEGSIKDDSFLGVIYAAEPDCDWTDEKVWRIANPGLGESVKIEYMRRKCREAQNKPSYTNTFKRLHLNIWVGAGAAWLPWGLWAKCAGKYEEESLFGKKCWLALDLSRRIDLSALTAVFYDEETKGLKSIHRFWMPEDMAEEAQGRDRVPYKKWNEEGFLNFTNGGVIDLEDIFEEILWFYKNFDVQELAYDSWGSDEIVKLLRKHDIEPVEFRQGFKSMSPAMKDLEILIRQKRYTHPDNPLMNWMISSVVTKMDEAENIKPDKKKSRTRIDGPVSLIMASGRCLGSSDHLSSIYDDKDLQVV